MDLLVLIDRLDDLVHNAKAVPLTDQVRIDRETVYDLLDQMRATIPAEIMQARLIVKEQSAGQEGGGNQRVALIERLAALHQAGALTDTEFALEKTRLLTSPA